MRFIHGLMFSFAVLVVHQPKNIALSLRHIKFGLVTNRCDFNACQELRKSFLKLYFMSLYRLHWWQNIFLKKTCIRCTWVLLASKITLLLVQFCISLSMIVLPSKLLNLGMYWNKITVDKCTSSILFCNVLFITSSELGQNFIAQVTSHVA